MLLPNWRIALLLLAEMMCSAVAFFLIFIWMRAALLYFIETKTFPEPKECRESKYMIHIPSGIVWFDIVLTVLLCGLKLALLEWAGADWISNFFQRHYCHFTTIGVGGVVLTSIGDEYLISGPFNTHCLMYCCFFGAKMLFICIYTPVKVKDDYYRQLITKLIGLLSIQILKQDWWTAGACFFLLTIALIIKRKEYHAMRYRGGIEPGASSHSAAAMSHIHEHIINIDDVDDDEDVYMDLDEGVLDSDSDYHSDSDYQSARKSDYHSDSDYQSARNYASEDMNDSFKKGSSSFSYSDSGSTGFNEVPAVPLPPLPPLPPPVPLPPLPPAHWRKGRPQQKPSDRDSENPDYDLPEPRAPVAARDRKVTDRSRSEAVAARDRKVMERSRSEAVAARDRKVMKRALVVHRPSVAARDRKVMKRAVVVHRPSSWGFCK